MVGTSCIRGRMCCDWSEWSERGVEHVIIMKSMTCVQLDASNWVSPCSGDDDTPSATNKPVSRVLWCGYYKAYLHFKVFILSSWRKRFTSSSVVCRWCTLKTCLCIFMYPLGTATKIDPDGSKLAESCQRSCVRMRDASDNFQLRDDVSAPVRSTFSLCHVVHARDQVWSTANCERVFHTMHS